MTRIVAGTAGGRTLVVPGSGTRPTSERVREALFSRLEHLDVVTGAQVLDLFAGSGALGLEAASRGARAVVLVEHARAAVEACRRNARSLALGGVEVVAERVLPYLRRSAAGAPTLDLVLVDPPYDLPEDELGEVLALVVDRLADGAVVVVERSTRSPEPRWPVGLAPTGSRRYGETLVWFAAPGTEDRREPLPRAAPGS